MTVHAMIDIEALGIKPNSVITQIGICVFSRAGILDSINIGVDHHFQKERKTDRATIAWWEKQKNPPFLKEVFVPFTALSKMSLFLQMQKVEYFWANGIHYDIAQLESLCQQHSFTPPWQYNKVMDMRTIMKLANVTRPTEENSHNGEEDAIAQAQTVIQLFENYDFTF